MAGSIRTGGPAKRGTSTSTKKRGGVSSVPKIKVRIPKHPHKNYKKK